MAVRHGFVWTRKVNAKTVTKFLSKDQAVKCKEYIANTRRLEGLIDEIREESLKVLLEGK